MNKTKSIVVGGIMVAMGFASCSTHNNHKHRNPGKIYAPDMTYSRAYDAYTENPNFADGQTSRPPVAGTVAMGHELPDHLMEGDTNAYKSFTTNMRFNEAEMAEGKRLFNIYCGICHGTNLDGQGPLYTSGKFAAMPANFKDGKYLHMTSGTMYAAIKFGKNLMGSYASQLDVKQRWMVVAYIKQVQASNGGDAFTFGATTASTDTAKVTVIAENAVLVGKEEAKH